MPNTFEELLAQLTGIAAIFGAYENIEHAAELSGGELSGVPARFILRTALGSCKLKLTMPPDSEGIIARAEKLKKQSRAVGRMGTCKKSRGASLRRAGYSAAVARTFIAAGEKDNLREYEALFI